MPKKAKIDLEIDVKTKIILPWVNKVLGWSFAPVSRGMGVHGIHDRISSIPITITSEMVGLKIGLSVNIEAKRPTKRHTISALQLKQVVAHRATGGISYVVACQEDLDELVNILIGLTQGILPKYPTLKVVKGK